MSMRILFSAVPAPGHLYPLLPLARAFDRRGDEVALLTSAGLSSVAQAEGFTHLAAGPMPDVLFAEVAQRTGHGAYTNPTPESVAEFFAGTRLDLGAAAALEAARAWKPDLVVNEMFDLIGVFVAGALGTPLATASTGPATPSEFLRAIAANAAPHFAAAGLDAPEILPAGRWVLDVCPDALGPVAVPEGVERWTLRPEAHRGPGAFRGPALPPPAPGRPRVLVTFGTQLADPEIVETTLDLLAGAVDADFIGTSQPGAEPTHAGIQPFRPLDELLDGVTAAVTHGGAGTILGLLSRGLPLVVVPQGADQFVQAAAVSATGCGLALPPGQPDPEQLREAVRTVLTDPAYAAAAIAVQKEIAAMTAPEQVAENLARVSA
jgi:UDP:flavonoid glycosyltransferase YjiC (YdhE family)